MLYDENGRKMFTEKKRIEAMHDMFGYANDFCKNCCHFGEYRYNRKYFKCKIYGVSSSEATDWRKNWQACGAFNVVTVRERDIYKYLARNKAKKDEPCEGQICMEIGERHGVD